MRRAICMMLGLAMLLSLAACGGGVKEEELATPAQETAVVTEPAVLAERDRILDMLLEDWVYLLTLQERRLAQEQYALEWILKIGEESSWENYVYARSACSFTYELIAHLAQKPVEPAMTTSDYQVLIGMGMDLADVQAEFRTYNEIALPELAAVDAVIWEHYLQKLLYDCFDENTAALFMETAKNRYEAGTVYLQYWYLVNNYIMLEIPEEYAQKLMDKAREAAPCIMAQYEMPFAATNDVLNEMGRVTDRLPELLIRSEELITASEVLRNEQVFSPKRIEKLPALVRFPEHVAAEAWEVKDYWKEGEQIQTAEYRMEMTERPNCMFLLAENITVDDYRRYVLELREDGMLPDDMSDTAALYILPEGGQMMVYFQENGLYISVTDGQVCFAPAWYLQAVNKGK